MKFLVFVLLAGCTTASVTTLVDGITPATDCKIQVFPTREAVKGEIEEVCYIDAVPSHGFDKSVGAAVENAKSKLPKCGVCTAYIKQSRPQGFWDSSAATLVGFKYKGK